jgi:hypothetical protein
MPAFGRDLIDKRLGDRLPEKQGSNQREVIELVPCGEQVWLVPFDASATVRSLCVASRASGAFLVMAISLGGVTVSRSKKQPFRPGWLNRP